MGKLSAKLELSIVATAIRMSGELSPAHETGGMREKREEGKKQRKAHEETVGSH